MHKKLQAGVVQVTNDNVTTALGADRLGCGGAEVASNWTKQKGSL
jgi:hypothetical protein